MSPARPKPYTETANHVLTLAHQISTNLYAGYTGTEHLLLALLLFKESGAYRLLQRAGISEEAINRRLRNMMVIHDKADGIPTNRPTDALNQSLSDALAEAEVADLPYVATEQLLVALLRQPDTVGARVLAAESLDLGRARELAGQLHSAPNS